MFARSSSPLPFAATALSFALGAALVWSVDAAVRRARARTGPISDDIVLERVRERVATIVSRPEAVEVSVENGVVRLAGQVPPEERDQLLSQLLWLPGVIRLRNALGTDQELRPR
ncbi:BON domain-containing protein [Ramlibacter sp. PS4R-6]|uniref:BON domain-containing protein n=1 Tax=Ramlibacter sp. PS4R-6 TaxID=3133438 RepID=UPI0030AC1CCE